ncbi:hypothetical protein P691DRAFT_658074 [Macrolepiota fuliginosa MF-IS2]|uniref:Zn(2)-C6 fungal-type domain-containing protein n=1 Tax=Macrolepiota fuliginosa MF-IS2 TaxID=1400762 RepID=A0A9P6C6H9_9AGAR|nr:hypothetical protein P691DRAFT_658074 [Macrolepiota fuliginosa MF-IS2]
MPAQREDKKGLQRGSACLSCRCLFQRCNGDRPYCGPCVEHQRLHECVYDDHRRKSRTQLLREKVASLERKLAELEANPQTNPQTTFVIDSPVAGSSPSLTTGSPFGGASPDGLEWHLSEPSQTLEGTSSSLHWPDPIASNIRLTANMYPDYSSDLLQPRQTTPVSNISFSSRLTVFIAHRAQCHFYSSMTRFQSPRLQQLEEQPHPALLQAINLLGCYFSRDPELRSLETDLLKQSLHEITVSLRDCKHLCDVVQASSLLALYCYFNSRFVEGYRHAFVAARLAVALNLHQIPYPDPEYLQNYGAYYDRVAAFWQVYMVDRAWSGVHGILAALSDDEHRGQITTPMMWTSDSMAIPDPLLIPNFLCHLLDYNNIINPCMDTISLPASKALASAIFDRTFHPLTGLDKDPVTHPSVIVAMQRIQNTLPPFVGREVWSPQAPHVDVELLVVHTMLRVAELKVCEEEENRIDGDVKLLWAVEWLTRSVGHLGEDDYAFLDPLIAVRTFRIRS